jgi:hypothetical protein
VTGYTAAGDWVLADLLPLGGFEDPGFGIDLARLVGQPGDA